MIEVVCGALIQQGKVLIARRNYGSSKGMYEFPGGKVEKNETKEEALIREMKEELDIDIQVSEDNYFMSINHVYPDFEITMHSFYVIVGSPYFVMKDHLDYKWLDVKELKSLDWAPADEPIIEKLMAV